MAEKVFAVLTNNFSKEGPDATLIELERVE